MHFCCTAFWTESIIPIHTLTFFVVAESHRWFPSSPFCRIMFVQVSDFPPVDRLLTFSHHMHKTQVIGLKFISNNHLKIPQIRVKTLFNFQRIRKPIRLDFYVCCSISRSICSFQAHLISGARLEFSSTDFCHFSQIIVITLHNDNWLISMTTEQNSIHWGKAVISSFSKGHPL